MGGETLVEFERRLIVPFIFQEGGEEEFDDRGAGLIGEILCRQQREPEV